mmetsp:Transcript_35634/g.39417  ORF Transcript_35634/g.39417 Transcript_35634/m.39417 type:complete len:273 (+) Transcript_35634:35-853(+)
MMINTDKFFAIMKSATTITGRDDYCDDMLDTEITKQREQLSEMRKLRKDEREKFSENHGTYCIRQHYCTQEINRLLEPKVAKAPHYTHALKKLSDFNYPSYIISKESELCQALHQVEVLTNQQRVFIEYHKKMVNELTTRFDEQTQIGEDIREHLSNGIKSVSMDIAAMQVEKTTKLNQQRHIISRLNGEKPIREEIYDRRWSLSRSSSQSSVVSNTSSILSDASSIVSNIFLRLKNKKKTTDVKTKPRNDAEKRIAKVYSYFGSNSTAEAA